jgi:hypothetical protein
VFSVVMLVLLIVGGDDVCDHGHVGRFYGRLREMPVALVSALRLKKGGGFSREA